MKASIKFAKNAILNQEGINHVQIEVAPPKLDNKEAQKPVCIVFAIDRSGSMSGLAQRTRHTHNNDRHLSITTPINLSRGNVQRFGRMDYEENSKINYARTSIVKFLDLLSPNDKVGILSFDDIASIEQKLVAITNTETKKEVITKIQGIVPTGCTNIGDALEKARSMFTEEDLLNYNCKILLLSDGVTNRGVVDIDGLATIALSCAKKGITISSLGIGLDYDSSTMGEIAKSGNGLLYYVNDLSKLGKIFSEELEFSSIISAKDVKVYVETPKLLEVYDNSNGYSQETTNKGIEIRLGDISNSRKIVIEIRNDFIDKDIDIRGRIEYRDLDGESKVVKFNKELKVVTNKEELGECKENTEVIEYALSLIKNETLLRSSALYEHGNLEGVTQSFGALDLRLDSLQQTYTRSSASIKNTQVSTSSIGFQYKAGTISEDGVKDIYASSYQESKR